MMDLNLQEEYISRRDCLEQSMSIKWSTQEPSSTSGLQTTSQCLMENLMATFKKSEQSVNISLKCGKQLEWRCQMLNSFGLHNRLISVRMNIGSRWWVLHVKTQFQESKNVPPLWVETNLIHSRFHSSFILACNAQTSSSSTSTSAN